MSKQTQALKLALEALEDLYAEQNAAPLWKRQEHWQAAMNKAEVAMPAIREALAEQPAQDEDQAHYKQVVDGVREAFDAKRKQQPAQQQEPVAVMTVLHLKDRTEIGYGPALAGYDLPTGEYKLYISSQPSKPWVGLTDEEKSDLWCESTGRDCVNEDTHVFADAIEAKLREKNA